MLKDLRKISIRKMASNLGISPTYLSDIEKGARTPSPEIYHKMLDYYGEGLKEYFTAKQETRIVLKRVKE